MFTRATVDHVASDHEWLWDLLYVQCLCVVPLSQPSSRELVYPLLGCFVYEKSSIYIYIYIYIYIKLTRGLKNCKRHRIVNIILMEYITSSLSLSLTRTCKGYASRLDIGMVSGGTISF